jgi:hypothetical protein
LPTSNILAVAAAVLAMRRREAAPADDVPGHRGCVDRAIARLQAALLEKYVAWFRVKCDCAGGIAGLRPDKPPAPEPAG